MAKHDSGGNLTWFLAGITVGIAGAILFAPKTGEETRKSIVDATSKGRELAAETKRQATNFGRELYTQGREFVEEMKLPGNAAPDSDVDSGDSSAPSEGDSA